MRRRDLTRRAVLCILVCGLCAGRDGGPSYWQQQIDEIVGEISTPQERAAAIIKLIAIVSDETQAENLRYYAAYALGELGAVEAQDVLLDLADGLQWNDADRRLRWAFFNAHWMIKVASAPDEDAQIQLLIEALDQRFDGIIADGLRRWAADELANRGAVQALPAITAAIRNRGSGERGEEEIRLCTAKMAVLNANETRQEALVVALAMRDPFEHRDLNRWAIAELGALGTERSLDILIAYALSLQRYCYDADGRWIAVKGDPLVRQAHTMYGEIITILREHGMTEADIEAMGLDPRRYFVVI